jgi:flagellar motor switch protein FliM
MLTQSEIDALLTGAIEIEERDGQGRVNLAELMGQPVATGAPAKETGDERKIQSYNFWSPDRFSKEHMRAVELVHEDLAERLTTSLPTFLRTNLRPRLVHSEQGRFHDFMKDFQPNTLYHLITMAPMPGQLILTFSPNIDHMVLELRLGGRIEGAVVDRPLTDIDISLLRGLVEHMLNDIKAAWSKVVVVEPALEDSTINQNWVQMLMGNERVMLLTFELNLQGIAGTMNVSIPFSMLKPISTYLNPHVWITGRKEKQVDPAAQQAVLNRMKRVFLPVRVFLGETRLSLNEISSLHVGDVLKLNQDINKHLVVQVADQKRFTSQVGKMGNRLVVQIMDVIHDESDANIK